MTTAGWHTPVSMRCMHVPVGTIAMRPPPCCTAMQVLVGGAYVWHARSQRAKTSPAGTPRAKASGVGSARRVSHAGACASRHTGCHTGYHTGCHMGCMVGLMHQCNINIPGWLLTSVKPPRGNTSDSLQSGRCLLLHPRRFCTQLCRCGHRIMTGITFLSTGKQLLTVRVVCATTMSFSCVMIFDLLLGLKRPGTTDGAT